MFAKRVDVNQQDVVSALRFYGATVVVTSHVGNGFPDLIVGFHGRTFLLEVKDGKKGAAAKLTPAQERWIENWEGEPVFTARSSHEAVAFVCGFVPDGTPWKKGDRSAEVRDE